MSGIFQSLQGDRNISFTVQQKLRSTTIAENKLGTPLLFARTEIS